MSERKVLNKYYPPDYDPSKIPKLPKGAKSRQWVQRVMAPFNMRCNTCGEYIARAKKFNMRREKVVGEDYLGLMIFRFYLRCPRCVAEITFKTDLKNCDYEMEHGATRNFMAQTLIKREEAALKEEKANEVLDPMTVLENRTKDSQKEMAMIDTLEELQELQRKSSKISHDDVISMVRAPTEEQAKQELARQEAEDEAFVRSIFGGGSGRDVEVSGATQCEETPRVKRLQDSSSSSSEEDEEEERTKKKKKWNESSSSFGSGSNHGATTSSSFASSSSATSSASSSSSSSGVPSSKENATFAVPSTSSSSSSSSSSSLSSSKGKQPAAWNKSVGSLGSLKKSSLVVVKKKSTSAAGSVAGSVKVSVSEVGSANAKQSIVEPSNDAKTVERSELNESSGTNFVGTGSLEVGSAGNSRESLNSSENVGKSESEAPSTGLLGLGAYSDSDESD